MRLFFTLLLFCCALAPVRAQNFRVQAAAFAAPVAPAYFKDRGVEGVIGSTDANGIYRYFVGNYATLEAAEAARDLLVAKGFPNATVIDLAVQRALYEKPLHVFCRQSDGRRVRHGYERQQYLLRIGRRKPQRGS